MTRPLILCLIGISCLLFGSAVALPIFTLEPKAGEWTPLAQIISPSDMQAKAMRLLEGVVILWNEGEKMLALLIAIFSLILPTLKLTMLWMEGILSEGLPEKWALFLRAVSRYAMLEVFLVALTVLLIKEMPGGSRVTLQAGFYTFSASVLLSLMTAHWMERATKSA